MMRNTLSNAANHFRIFLIEFEICLYKHLYFLYIRNPLFPIGVFISMLWQLNPLDPTDLPSNMRYFPRISPNSLKISPKFRANSLIQSLTYVYLCGKMWKNMEKRPFFRAATAGLGKYHTGGYGRIGVYRVKVNRFYQKK